MLSAEVVTVGVRHCQGCALHQECTLPVPFRGPVPAAVAVMGEAPGKDEDAAGEPFVGRAGRLLGEHLGNAGINLDECFVFNTVSCWPSLTKTPETRHIDACRTNADIQLVLSQARYVLVLGNTALHHWKPDDAIGQVRGEPWRAGGLPGSPLLFPTFHPAAVLRNKALTWRFSQDLRDFAKMTLDG